MHCNFPREIIITGPIVVTVKIMIDDFTYYGNSRSPTYVRYYRTVGLRIFLIINHEHILRRFVDIVDEKSTFWFYQVCPSNVKAYEHQL